VLKVTKIITDRPLHFKLQRGDQIIENTAASSQIEYTDTEGFKRAYGKIGVTIMHRPLSLKSITSVNGIDVKDDMDKAREAIAANMDKETIIGMKSVDGKIHDYWVNISSEVNYNLNNQESRDYKRIYTGTIAGNFYLKMGIAEGAANSIKEAKRLVLGFAQSLRKPWHIDGTLITPDTKPFSRDNPWKARLYRIIYFTAFVSICVGIINFLPFPGFDGGVLILLIAEAIKSPIWAEQNKYRLLVSALGIVYGSVALSHLLI
jgi:hypothetical protein